ncbi:MAG: hypothetical protein COA91_01050 [Robiginitomaculum sp.]|nr:MAG: hypothetical protein COA91_01050 [Robiginitomaculum sp.]
MTKDQTTKKAFETAAKLFGGDMPKTGAPKIFGEASFAHIYGEIWPRAGLDLKTRSLITVAALVATNKPEELAIHLKGALNMGWTQDQLAELMLHLSYYAGFPSGIEGAKVLADICRDGG